VAVFLLPLVAAWFLRFLRAAAARPLLWLLPLTAIVLYQTTFEIDHEANLFGMDYYLRNFTLVYVKEHPWAHVAFGAAAVIAACAMSQVRWPRPSFALLLPVSAVFVSFF